MRLFWPRRGATCQPRAERSGC